MKLCVLALAQTANGSVNLRNGSRLTANGCMLHSNSTNRRAVTIGEGSTLKATTVCARGGIQNIGSSVEGNLITDCPDMKDPLASKPEPKPMPCAAARHRASIGHADTGSRHLLRRHADFRNGAGQVQSRGLCVP